MSIYVVHTYIQRKYVRCAFNLFYDYRYTAPILFRYPQQRQLSFNSTHTFTNTHTVYIYTAVHICMYAGIYTICPRMCVSACHIPMYVYARIWKLAALP